MSVALLSSSLLRAKLILVVVSKLLARRRTSSASLSALALPLMGACQTRYSRYVMESNE
jgi:hypothetical protein